MFFGHAAVERLRGRDWLNRREGKLVAFKERPVRRLAATIPARSKAARSRASLPSLLDTERAGGQFVPIHSRIVVQAVDSCGTSARTKIEVKYIVWHLYGSTCCCKLL